jgi:hypothetical protein
MEATSRSADFRQATAGVYVALAILLATGTVPLAVAGTAALSLITWLSAPTAQRASVRPEACQHRRCFPGSP